MLIGANIKFQFRWVWCALAFVGACLLGMATACAGVGDPQVKTNHPWYPGELACSTFERLKVSQADLYRRVTSKEVKSDQDRALASWLWRNTHYWHGEPGMEDLWGQGFGKGPDTATREYWTGLFAHGFGLCGTTHAQWTAEAHALLGHNRGRTVGTTGHNSFEAYLAGGPYGNGKWVLLDHDISTVVFDSEGTSLLSIDEVRRDYKRLTDRRFQPNKQCGWLVCGLHPDDGGAYASFATAEYFSGYSGPPPIVHLRRGESLRKYLAPGLEDGKTFVFWGRNYNTDGIPGPERAHTWVNQPEAMYRSKDGAGYKPGQARFANAVYTYQPDFTTTDYREGVIDESDQQVTFEFQTPYIIGASPPNDRPWGIYDSGCRQGLVLEGRAKCEVAISTDRGHSWTPAGTLDGRLDLTDHAKGRRQYWLRFQAGAKSLAGSGLTITTVCQCNSSIIPRLTDHGSEVRFLASGQGLVSAGPNVPQALPQVVSGKFDSPQVTLGLATPRHEPATALYAAAHVRSSNPPSPDVEYKIEFSTDDGKSWSPLIKDWRITRRGNEPEDFWSQSFCWGDTALDGAGPGQVQFRFSNTGGKQYARAEVHLAYRVSRQDPTLLMFHWIDDEGAHTATRKFAPGDGKEEQLWRLSTAKNVQTKWVEYRPIAN
jgi:hypothetical protein